jgi:hypothetical protein
VGGNDGDGSADIAGIGGILVVIYDCFCSSKNQLTKQSLLVIGTYQQ